MTNQEYFEKLHFEYELSLMNYWIAAHRIFEEGNGFIDKKFFWKFRSILTPVPGILTPLYNGLVLDRPTT